MTRILFALLALILPACQRPPVFAEAADETIPEAKQGTFPEESLTVGNQKRVYRLVVPKSVDLTKPAPLVIAFHGMGIDSKDLMPKYTKLDDLAADKKFLLVYPEAV